MSTTPNKAVLTLEDGRIHATTIVNGVQSIKQIAPDSLARLIQEQTAMATPLLPGRNGVKLYSRKDNVEYIAYTTEPKKRTFMYYDTEITSPTPRLMWFVAVDNSRGDTPFIRQTELFALRNEILGEEDRLCRAPFPNVYSSNGICWEGNLQENIRSMNAAASVESQFFAARFNHDLDESRVRTDYSDEYRDEDGDSRFDSNASIPLYMHLQERGIEEFPNNELMDTEFTIRSGFDHFIRTVNNAR